MFHLNINAAENYRNAHHVNPLGAVSNQHNAGPSASAQQPAGTYITLHYTINDDTAQSYSMTLRSDLPVDYLKLQLQAKHQFAAPTIDVYDSEGQPMPDPLSLSDVPAIQHAINSNEEIRVTVATADGSHQGAALAAPTVASILPGKSAAEELYELEDDDLVDSDNENDAEEFDEDEDEG